MGDAGLPLGEDAGAGLFYNPANIAKSQKPNVEMMNLTIYTTTDYVAMLNRNFYKSYDLQSFSPTLTSHPDQFAGSGVQLLPGFHTKGFSFGLLLNHEQGAQYKSATSEFNYRSNYQLIPSAGTGVKLAGGIVRLGYSVQWVNQSSGDITVANTASTLSYREGLKQGSGLSHNVGAALTIPWRFLPQFNVVLRNVGSLKYSDTSLVKLATNSGGKPADEPMTVDASFNLQPKSGGGGFYNFVVEMRDATNRSKTSPIARLALGMEWSYKDNIYARFGFSDYYPHAGIGLRNKSGEFGLTWMSEELGAQSKTNRSTRYLLHYRVGVF